MIAYPDFAYIEENTVKIGEEIFPDMYIKTVITAKHRFDVERFAC